MSKQPILRVLVKTKSTFEDNPNSWMNLCTMWQGDNGYISGKFADGSWSPAGKPKFAVTNLIRTKEVLKPAEYWLNAKIEGNEGRIWIKHREDGENVSICNFTFKDVDGKVRIDDYNWNRSMKAIAFEVIQPDGEVENYEIPVNEMFLNGYVNLPSQPEEPKYSPEDIQQVPF